MSWDKHISFDNIWDGIKNVLIGIAAWIMTNMEIVNDITTLIVRLVVFLSVYMVFLKNYQEYKRSKIKRQKLEEELFKKNEEDIKN
ncbi:MAG: hypothetical protein KatS3mg096_580 [Candidatus Parcubacteria bacterium]|nr:MAG: hypothetical protein KatS3mg096_580 [Candidatus Parcubacteria bacterium]